MWHVRGNALKNQPAVARLEPHDTAKRMSTLSSRLYICINPLATLVVARGLFVFSCRYMGDDSDD